MATWPPPCTYLVCATPRSGSTLLCETLRATGHAGVPLEHFEVFRHSSLPRQSREHFLGVENDEILTLLAPLEPPNPDPSTAAQWWAGIREAGATPDGTWGGKLMWGHVDNLLERAHELEGVPPGADLDAVLTALFGGGLRMIHMTRPDKVDQAVSLWRAVQTRAWRAGDEPIVERAQYVFGAIDHLVAQLEEQDAAWLRWFAQTGRPAHEVRYDELAADPAGVVGDALRALGLPDDEIPAPATRRQGDDESRAWAERYRAERGVAI